MAMRQSLLLHLTVGFMGALFLGGATASPLRTAIDRHEVLRLEALSRDAGTPEELRLAQGAALALRHQDAAALAILTADSQAATSADNRAAACMALSDIYLRQSRFAEAHAALQCAAEGSPLRGEAKQALLWSDILAAEKPMQWRSASGKLEAVRDAAGLLRVRVAINGQAQEAVLDTDASFCVVSEATARRLGVRVLEKAATILTSTQSDLPMHLGIADSLTFGEAVFHNVVFAVLSDGAMRLGHGYKMEAVIGLPIFVALGRVTFQRDGGWESLLYGHQAGEKTGAVNMALSGLDPFVMAAAPKSGAQLRLAIDSAATNTTLNATALTEFPALGEGASSGWAAWQGGGGVVTDRKALTLADLTLSIAGRAIPLKRVKILSSPEPDRHGAIGQDVFKHAKSWTLDFDAMWFGVEE